MNVPLISIIVPCYNVEKYISRCVESIINQSYNNMEIILVDDGSTDDTGKFLDEYALNDHRIKVIHKVNGGMSDARNAALDVMTGTYVSFIDSDDFISKDYVESLYKLIKEYNVEVALSGNDFVTDGVEYNERKQNKILSKLLLKEEALTDLMYQNKIDTAPWAKMFAARLFKYRRFPKGLISEDLATMYLVFLDAESFAWNNRKSYHYLHRSSSIEGMGYSLKKYDSYIYIIKQFENDKKLMSTSIQVAANCRIVSLLFHLILVMPSDEKEKTQYIWSLIKKYRREVILDCHARKKTRIAALLSYGGLNFLNLFAGAGQYRKYIKGN